MRRFGSCRPLAGAGRWTCCRCGIREEVAQMAEQQEATGVAEQEQQEEEFQYPITIEDVGPAAKKVTVEIPRERIDAKLQEQFKDLRRQAHVPGFRVGH